MTTIELVSKTMPLPDVALPALPVHPNPPRYAVENSKVTVWFPCGRTWTTSEKWLPLVLSQLWFIKPRWDGKPERRNRRAYVGSGGSDSPLGTPRTFHAILAGILCGREEFSGKGSRLVIHHEDGNGLNNEDSNLFITTRKHNQSTEMRRPLFSDWQSAAAVMKEIGQNRPLS